MDNIKLNFNKKLFLPVIHVVNYKQCKKNVLIAVNHGADGVFLINHDVNFFILLGIYNELREEFPNLWIGLNNLDPVPSFVYSIITVKNLTNIKPQAFWSDDAFDGYLSLIHYILPERDIKNIEWMKKCLRNVNNMYYFGGIAFKYQRKIESEKELIKITNNACKYLDIICTSGLATGVAPSIDKINLMSDTVHKYDKKLAIASGITVSNINDYKKADIFMVSTGISNGFYYFNEKLVYLLSNKIKELNK